MTKVTGLVRRGSTYSMRRRVPTDLVEAPGKKEVVIGLHTSKLAAEAARHESVRPDMMWTTHREALKRGEAVDPDRVVSETELRRAVVGDFWKREQAATALPDESEIRENVE
ncbi:hypothetical protein K9B32_13465 [Rhizobium sp. 3T7]|uniref:DUF6538 domain-containing protein n=1 Tax=Rhizobium sp. 3T7 TaxID=2874922 RepID=UPI001CC9DAA1|nr:DUF6538 domain-containing protein [Rhizobium sp. 3T7]MBZ9791122.1 hypothetical protein [Rhizobium sp. 3T7]